MTERQSIARKEAWKRKDSPYATEEYREKIREKRIKWLKTHAHSKGMLGKKHSERSLKLMSKKQSGHKPTFVRPHTQEEIERIIKNRNLGYVKREMKLQTTILDKHFPNFVRTSDTFTIGRYNPDFTDFKKKIVIELCCSITTRMKKKIAEYQKCGYKVIVIPNYWIDHDFERKIIDLISEINRGRLV
jgi:very-short-patch-repair endonuclease